MRNITRDLIIILVLAIIILLVARFVLGSYIIAGESMHPGLQKNQHLLVYRPAYAFSHPDRGDIVYYRSPEGTPFQLKRVIGVPGDLAEVRSGDVYINKTRLVEPYIFEQPEYTLEPFVVPPGNYFVLGDNRNNSSDSSSGWTVPEDNIQGKAWIVVWPFANWGDAGNYSLDSQLEPYVSH
ncbi:MAG: signal peptidase I [Dehalococcoidales bacterium]|nr:signal peptidase I [Dehalococcoidales bacterium]